MNETSEVTSNSGNSPRWKTVITIAAVIVVASLSVKSLLHRRALRRDRAIATVVTEAGGTCRTYRGMVTQVSFSGDHVQTQTIKKLAGLRNLKRVVFIDTPFSDQDLAELTTLPIAELILVDTDVSDRGLQQLKRLETLTYLHLSGGRISGRGLQAIGELNSLTRLDIESIELNDEQLQRLEGLYRLKDLYLSEVDVSRNGLDRLQRSLPQADIFLDMRRH